MLSCFAVRYMKRMLQLSFLVIPLCHSLSLHATVFDNISQPELGSQTYLLVDYQTGTVLAEKNADSRQAPASLTKIMTGYVVGDAIKQKRISNNDIVTVSEAAWGQKFPGASKMFLNINQKVTLDELNTGAIVASGNDACVALAEFIAGSEANFIKSMNSYAEALGLTNTHFNSVHGLDAENQYTTAKDMATLVVNLIRNLPEQYKLHSQKEFSFNNINQRNRNGLLWDTSLNVDGVKTGYTSTAGYNLVASAVNNDTRLISVVMGAESIKARESDSKALLQWGMNNFETLPVLKANTSVLQPRVYYGKENQVDVGVIGTQFVTLPKGSLSKLKATYQMSAQYLEAPLKQGQVVGKITYELDGKPIASHDLQVINEVEKAGILGRMIDWIIVTVKNIF